MEQQIFLNEYITQLSNQFKQLSMDKLTLTVQQTLLQRRVDELGKVIEGLNSKVAELTAKIGEEFKY